jgi:hypothetical protein
LPAPAGPTDMVYRFPYLPAFRPAFSVRIERRDSIRMTLSQTDGWARAGTTCRLEACSGDLAAALQLDAGR